jgi:ferritin-like metal-binding protein YciE
MAQSGSLHDAFLDELHDAYDAEKQLVKALPKLATAATSTELRDAFESHLQETRGHVQRIEQVLDGLGEKVRGKHCDGIEGIIEEGASVIEEEFDDVTMDACLIAAGQRAEHYEMAAYGSMVAWARAMGHDDAADLLQQTLDEEKRPTRSSRRWLNPASIGRRRRRRTRPRTKTFRTAARVRKVRATPTGNR